MNFFQRLKGLSNKEINPYTVSCKAVFRNVDKTLVLYVRSDAPSLMVGLKESEGKLRLVVNETDKNKLTAAARFFASAIFREDQADELIKFYDDPTAVIAAVGMFFDRQLKQEITKAQKK